MATIHDIIAAQVAKAKAEAHAEERKSWSAGDVEWDEERLAAAHNQRILDLWSGLPHLQRAVGAWLAKLAVVKPYLPLAPMQRTTTGQAAHVTCFGWHNPKAVNQYVREANVFWLAYGRQLEQHGYVAPLTDAAGNIIETQQGE